MTDPRDDDDLILEIRDRFRAAKMAWGKIQEQGDIDMRHVAGDPWKPRDRRARESAKRPILKLDELNQYFNQTINNVRQNPRAIKFTPKGNGANDQTAEFYANKMRDIEYQSHAPLAYITAYENAVQRSYGWAKWLTKYADDHVPMDAVADPRYGYQDLWIEPVPNPNTILPDPMWKRPEISDINYLFETEVWRKTEFKAEFGDDATYVEFSPEFVRQHQIEDWVKAETILLAAYWNREKVGTRKLLVFKPEKEGMEGRTEWYDEKKEYKSDQIRSERSIADYRVTNYLTNGVEILRVTPWRGRFIPFAACTGKVIYVDQEAGPERRILSMTRLARDPAMLYCYIRSLELETMGMVTKFPYFYYEGQITAENVQKLGESLHKPIAGIPVKPTLEGLGPNVLLPFPQRNLLAPDLQAYEVFAEAARRAIQAAMGISPLPTAAQRQNEKSGVALERVEKAEQVGSFHFTDHYNDFIRHMGVIGEDLMDKIYDTMRDVSVRKWDESAQMIRINDPKGSQIGENGSLSGQPVFTAGDHTVTVGVGPSVDSQRDAVSDSIEKLSGDPNIMARAGDLIVRIQARTANLGSLMDELAERLEPPDVKQAKLQEQQGTPDPKVLMQQVQVLQGQSQQKDQAIAKLTMEINTRRKEYQEQRATKKMELDAKTALEIKLKEMDAANKVEIARIQAARQAGDIAAESAEERLSTGLELAHEATENARDRLHDVRLENLTHAHATAESDQEHDHALELGDQGIAGTMATQAHDAALQPPATDGNGAGA